MADTKKKEDVTARDGVIVQGEVLTSQDPADSEPQEMTLDGSTVRALKALADATPEHFAHGDAAVVTDEQRKAADESRPVGSDGKKEKESHLYQEATYWPSAGSYAYAVIESEFDDGTVDVNTALGRFRRIPLALVKKDSGGLNYPRVELGKA